MRPSKSPRGIFASFQHVMFVLKARSWWWGVNVTLSTFRCDFQNRPSRGIKFCPIFRNKASMRVHKLNTFCYANITHELDFLQFLQVFGSTRKFSGPTRMDKTLFLGTILHDFPFHNQPVFGSTRKFSGRPEMRSTQCWLAFGKIFGSPNPFGL